MEKQKVFDIMEDIGMMLTGHFLLTSGRHSKHYMQCAKLFQYPQYSKLFCANLIYQFEGKQIDMVVGPAVGGIIMAYEVASQLGVKNIFAERENGVMTFRRGFEIQPGANVLVVEDVVTTGGSVAEVIELIKGTGANVVGVGCIVDRSNGKVDFGVPFRAVVFTEVVSYLPEECPLCKEGLPLVKPGSRKTKIS